MKKIFFSLLGLCLSLFTFAQGTQLHIGVPIYHANSQITIGNSDVPPLFLNRNGNGTHTVFQRSSVNKGYVGLGNSGTSFYLASYSDFGLRVNGSGSDSFYLRSDGNVGIGTTSPNTKLDVSGIIQTKNYLKASYNGDILIGVDIGGYYIGTGTGVNSTLPMIIGSHNSRIQFNAGGTERFRITDNGNVGIGTISPLAKLHIEGNVLIKSGEKLQWGGTQTAIEGSTVSNKIALFTNSLERMRVDDGGNVGIGTTSPSHTLTVKGGASATKGINIMDANARIYFDGKRAMEGHVTNSRLDIAEGYGTTQIFGNVGLGVSAPSRELEIYGSGNVYTKIFSDSGSNATLELEETGGTNWSLLNEASTNEFKIRQDGQTKFTISDIGNIGVGTTNPSEKLAVDGTVLAKKVRVSTAGADWPDFVFNSNYKLRTLNEVEAFVKVNQHLPEVPSAKEIAVNGLDLGKMDATLLKKVEELTLYMIQMNKNQENLIKEVETLKKENTELRTVIKGVK